MGVWTKLAVARSVLEEICLHGETNGISLTGLVHTTGDNQEVAQIHIIFGDDATILQQDRNYPFSVDQQFTEMLVRTKHTVGDADLHFESTEGVVQCHSSSDHASVVLLRGKTDDVSSIQFIGIGDVELELFAVLDNGSLATGHYASQIHPAEEHQLKEEVAAETKLISALDAEKMKARELSWGYYSFINSLQATLPHDTPRPTPVPVPTPTAQTFAPTRTVQPTISVSPTYSEPCDYGIKCKVEESANVDIEGYLFPCLSLIEFSKNGLVAPDVCEATKDSVRDSCVCQTNVRSASREKSKNINLLTKAPTAAPTKHKSTAFSYPKCEVCHANEQQPLVISGAEFKCSDLRYYGSMGFLPPDLCPIAQRHASENCGCADGGLESTTRSDERPSFPSSESAKVASSASSSRWFFSKATLITGPVVLLLLLLC